MTREQLETLLVLIQENDQATLYRTLDGASRQLTELESDYREGQQRLARLANAARRALASYQAQKRKIVDVDIPFYRQEIAMIGQRTSGANIRHLLAKKLIALDQDRETLDKKMRHRLRQVRLEARATLDYGNQVKAVEEAYLLISEALRVHQLILDEGIDPTAMTSEDMRRIETLVLKG